MLSRLAKIIYVEFTLLRSNRTQKLNVIYIYICSRSYNTPSLRDKGSQQGQLLYSGVIFSRWRTTLSPRAEKLLHRRPHSPRELCGVHPLAPKWEGEEELRVTLFISWTHGEKITCEIQSVLDMFFFAYQFLSRKNPIIVIKEKQNKAFLKVRCRWC